MTSSSTKITNGKIYKAKATLKKPIADATHTLHEISFLVLKLQLANGVVGESYLLSFQYSPNAILGALKDMLPTAIGYEAYETGKLYERYNQDAEYFGNQGINRWAQAGDLRKDKGV